ncbi:MAG: 2-succinyl-5-enolpyruvyl-6-hydroxy-3-cyclohexene-1-carboxylic-acid synthase [Bacteroidales bacterium]
MTPDKKNIEILAHLLIKKGVTHVVSSSGSRNAPVIILFNRTGAFRMYSIPDERAAGFFALGMAQRLQRPVALLCTSGTAALNYYPALAEAFYQQIPLIAITADRPAEWIDQGDGQTLRQKDVFAKHVRYSISLPEDSPNERYVARLINSAIDRAVFPVAGPIHVNLPLREPLYNLEVPDAQNPSDFSNKHYPLMHIVKPAQEKLSEEFSKHWKTNAKKMLLVGQMMPQVTLQNLLAQLADDPSVIILTETTSNVYHPNFIGCIDRVIESMSEQEKTKLQPDLLVTLGGAIVSKKIKALLRQWPIAQHWNIHPDPDTFHVDTYLHLTHTFFMQTKTFLEGVVNHKNNDSAYREAWLLVKKRAEQRHQRYMAHTSFTDLFVYQEIFTALPKDMIVHLGNSTPIRYAQLLDHQPGKEFFGNRGTSGIDGCISTAAGHAQIANKPVTVITGDIGFFYESNALWNKHLPPDFTIILINNGGGNIFRIIEGPDRYQELEPFIETTHQTHAKGLAETFGAEYLRADDFKSLREVLRHRYGKPYQRPAVIEIVTPGPESALILKQYFQNLRNS